MYAYGVNCKSDSMHISRNNDRAVIPGSSITPAPGAAKEIKGDGENPTLTGVLTLRDADTGRMRFVDIKTGTEYEVPYTGSTDIQDAYGKIKQLLPWIWVEYMMYMWIRRARR